MESLLIKGGIPLHGEVTISGAKNAVLPIMAATLLTSERCIIRRVPKLTDVTFMGQILSSLGAQVTFEDNVVSVQAARALASAITISSARCAARSASWGLSWPACTKPASPCPAVA